jgi:hypothetical protein
VIGGSSGSFGASWHNAWQVTFTANRHDGSGKQRRWVASTSVRQSSYQVEGLARVDLGDTSDNKTFQKLTIWLSGDRNITSTSRFYLEGIRA